MSIEENKRLVLEFLERLHAHRVVPAFDLVADDAIWCMPGSPIIEAEADEGIRRA